MESLALPSLSYPFLSSHFPQNILPSQRKPPEFSIFQERQLDRSLDDTMSQHTEVDDFKQEVLHNEHGLVQHHIDVKEAAEDGHVATDEYGHALVDIDQAASSRLARKVSTP